jgi:6-phosphogluconolactonase
MEGKLMGRDAVRFWRLLGVFVVAVALTVPALASAGQSSTKAKAAKASGAFYIQTNNPAGNTVIAYTRHANGTLTQKAVVGTGGKGAPGTPPFDFPTADGSGSVNLTPNGQLLFVVNAGDNSVSSFRITASGPKLVSHVGSHGKLPISLTSNGDLLYVVNENSGNIFGWTFSATGHLTPIAGSDQKLTAVTPKGKKAKVGVTAEIDFAADGDVLAVTQRGLPNHYGEIDTFLVSHSGAAGPSHAYATPGIPNPFGFSSYGHQLEVTNAGFVATPSLSPPNPAAPAQFIGTAADYDISSTGTLTFVKNTLTGGRAACWLVLPKNDKFAFVTNTLSGSVPTETTGTGAVSVFSVGPNGKLTLRSQANTGPGFPSDEALSPDGRYLYVTDAAVILPIKSHVDVYRVGPNGHLTHIQSTPMTLPAGISGAAAS